MTRRETNSLFVLVLAAVLVLMTWQDLHPRTDKTNAPLWALTYYIPPSFTAAQIPESNTALTIDVGSFTADAQGKAVWTPHGLPPTTFAQRQVNLQFQFKAIPQDHAETFTTMATALKNWKDKGDTVNLLLIDYAPEKGADLAAYAAFIEDARAAFKGTSAIYAGMNIDWFTRDKAAIQKLEDNTPAFLIRLPHPWISPDMMERLTALTHKFILQFPAGLLPKDLQAETLNKLSLMGGVTLTLDPAHPIPSDEPQVGLWPKF